MKRFVAVALFFAAGFLAAPPAHADQEPVTPTVVGEVVLATTGEAHEATVHLVIGNDGEAGPVTITFIDAADGKPLPVRRQGDKAVLPEAGKDAPPLTEPLDAHQAKTLDLVVEIGRGAVDGDVVVQGDGKAATAPFTTQRKPATSWLWITLLLSAAVAAGTVLFAWLLLGVDQQSLTAPLHLDAKWSFSESWASSLTAFAALSGTVLAASGLLEDVVHGVVVTRLAGMTLLYGAAVLAAPIVFLAFAKKPKLGSVDAPPGTVGGFLLAGGLTLAAALGQLSLIGILVYLARDDAGATFLGALLVLAAATLVCYVARTTHHAVRKPPVRHPAKKLPGAKKAAAKAHEARAVAAAAVADAVALGAGDLDEDFGGGGPRRARRSAFL
jgi:hypothetical protein